jgi:aspartate aminotransferase
VGEPDWATFDVAAKSGIAAINEGFSKYTAANGIPELREAICEQIRKEHGFEYTANQVTVGSGAKFILFAAFQMLCNEGDEVIIPSPYWVSYPVMVELAQGKSVIIDCGAETNFKVTPALLEKAITTKTKAFVFSSPSNPTGIAYTKEELKALAEVFKKHPQVVIISDDIYNHLMFGACKVAPHILDVAPELKDRVVIVNGVSKSYAMTGWRIGWALGPAPLIKAMGDYQSQSTSSPCSISQKAALTAIKNCDEDLIKANEMLKTRLEAAMTQIKTLPYIEAVRPDGAFYLWLNISKALGKKFDGQTIANSRDFATLLLEKYFVAAVPGVEFGVEGCLRISFAIGTERMTEALNRLKDMLQKLN